MGIVRVLRCPPPIQRPRQRPGYWESETGGSGFGQWALKRRARKNGACDAPAFIALKAQIYTLALLFSYKLEQNTYTEPGTEKCTWTWACGLVGKAAP